MTELITPVGRLIAGHPMVSQNKKDQKGNVKMQKDGITPQISFYTGFAIAKNETDWKQTLWGQIIYKEAVTCFPNGEYQSSQFAWKIEDGDSIIPNKKGKIPNQREGWLGHWIIHISNGFPYSCYHEGKFNPYESIQNKDEIKTGDYCRFVLDIRGNNVNGAVETNGVYINPQIFSLVRAGIKIISANEPDAMATLGNVPVEALPSNAQIDPNIQSQSSTVVNHQPQPSTIITHSYANPGNHVAPPPPQPGQVTPPPQPGQVTPPPQPGQVTPASDFVNVAPPAPPPDNDYTVITNGRNFKASFLKMSGWTDDQIKSLPRAEDDIPF